MKIRMRGLVAATAAAGLLLGGVGVVPAQAAPKTITVWADETRGPQLKKLIDGNTKIAPGYVVRVKFFASLTALQSAWDKATAASGPDVITGPSSFTLSAKSGKLLPLAYSAQNRREMPAATRDALTFNGKVYGVALDVDTTAMIWNTKFGAAPKSLKAMIDLYKTKKAAGEVTGGICAMEGVWGSHPILTAMGGGAWRLKSGKPDLGSVLINSAALKSNIKANLLGADGKSNGFFQWDNCGDAFRAGKMLAANTGAWNIDGITKAGVNFTVGAVPGLSSGTGQQWVNYSGAFVTSYSKPHGVELGAKKLVLGWFASQAGQTQMYNESKRPPANVRAAAAVTDSSTKAFALAASTGTPQFSSYLDNKSSGANWYDIVGKVYTDIFVTGRDVDGTLDKAAINLRKNFTAAASGR